MRVETDKLAKRLRALPKFRFGVLTLAMSSMLSACTSIDDSNKSFNLPFARPDKHRLIKMVDGFCVPEDHMESPDHLPMNGTFVNIPPVLWQQDLPIHILYGAENFGVAPRATRVHVPATGILVAVPEAPIAPELLPAMDIVDGIEIADVGNADEILQSLKTFKLKYLLLRDLKLGKAGIEAINSMPHLNALVMYGVSTDCLALLDPSRLKDLSVKAIDPDKQLTQLLQNCKTMNQLKCLNLDDSVISDAMSVAGRKVPNLKILSFDGSTINDSQLAQWLASCNLEQLGLHDTSITNDGLKLLKSQPSIEVLNISRCSEISDEGMTYVSQLSKLRLLDLCNTRVSDQGINYLSGLKRLRLLAIAGTAITPACLPVLAKFKSLLTLNISDNNLPFDGIQRLRQQLPNCDMPGTYGPVRSTH